MSWTNELYQVYENFHDQTEFPVSMVPIYHSSTKVQIEISIREDGEFSSARRLTKEEELTVLPVTEDSGARSSGIAPMPFTEKGSLRNVGVVKSICKQKQTAAYQSSNHGISATGGFTSHGYSCRNRVSFVN